MAARAWRHGRTQPTSSRSPTAATAAASVTRPRQARPRGWPIQRRSWSFSAGDHTTRSLTVTVPATATPGEYIGGLVVENDGPVQGEGAVAFDQIEREAIAVAITIPGARVPELKLGEANHEIVAGRSVVTIAARNTGNVRLKPAVLVLRDASGHRGQASTIPDGYVLRSNGHARRRVARHAPFARQLYGRADAHRRARRASGRRGGPLIVGSQPAIAPGGGGSAAAGPGRARRNVRIDRTRPRGLASRLRRSRAGAFLTFGIGVDRGA